MARECRHPFKRLETPEFGHLRCKRCGADLTPPERHFTVRHGPATTFSTGDRVRVRSAHMGVYEARFGWAEESPAFGLRYFVGELQRYREGKDGKGKMMEGVAAWRWADPETVRHAPGLRDRRAREEHVAP